MQVYWASVYSIPQTVIKDIERLMKDFLWGSSQSGKGKAKVAWKLKGVEFWDIGYQSNDSWGWRQMLRLRDIMKPHVHIDTNGEFWWRTSNNKLKPYSSNLVWKDLRDNVAKVEWYHVVWYPQITPKHAFISWLAVQQRLLTQDRLMKWYPHEVFKCNFSGKHEDSHSHLFFKCEFTSKVWEKKTKSLIVYKGLHNDLLSIVHDLAKYTAVKDIKNISNKIAIASAVYFVWMERNRRQFMKLMKSVDEVFQDIREYIRVKLVSIKVRSTSNVHQIASLCDLVIVGNSLQLM
ncbi:uncharacterized protein [Rutidosis leptorrhynchoides]|uniref:uncharacterized protein n=1 Tax=Rutidosis leptorrhynchoides TaxID=125765 RepID=UPI003A9A081B